MEQQNNTDTLREPLHYYQDEECVNQELSSATSHANGQLGYPKMVTTELMESSVAGVQSIKMVCNDRMDEFSSQQQPGYDVTSTEIRPTHTTCEYYTTEPAGCAGNSIVINSIAGEAHNNKEMAVHAEYPNSGQFPLSRSISCDEYPGEYYMRESQFSASGMAQTLEVKPSATTDQHASASTSQIITNTVSPSNMSIKSETEVPKDDSLLKGSNSTPVVLKKKPGRPKGSKNKPKDPNMVSAAKEGTYHRVHSPCGKRKRQKGMSAQKKLENRGKILSPPPLRSMATDDDSLEFTTRQKQAPQPFPNILNWESTDDLEMCDVEHKTFRLLSTMPASEHFKREIIRKLDGIAEEANGTVDPHPGESTVSCFLYCNSMDQCIERDTLLAKNIVFLTNHGFLSVVHQQIYIVQNDMCQRSTCTYVIHEHGLPVANETTDAMCDVYKLLHPSRSD